MNAAEPNPYAAPAADVNVGVLAPAVNGRLASRLSRLFATVLDGLLYVGTILVAIFGASVLQGLGGPSRPRGVAGVVTMAAGGLALLGLFVYQTYLLSTTGQTLGKKWLDVRIVKLDGQPVTFGSAFVLRSLVPLLFRAVPYLGMLFFFVDSFFIFREDRRCIHDFLAGTTVVDVER